jgi:hypothetical protein
MPGATGGLQHTNILLHRSLTSGQSANMHTGEALGGTSDQVFIRPGSIMSGILNLTATQANGCCNAHFVRKFSVNNRGGGNISIISCSVVGTDSFDVGITGPIIGVSAGSCALTVQVCGWTSASCTFYMGEISAVEIQYSTSLGSL